MAGARKRDTLSRGNNKFGDKEGWTDVTVRGDYNSSGKAGQVFPRKCSKRKKKCSMVGKFGKCMLLRSIKYRRGYHRLSESS